MTTLATQSNYAEPDLIPVDVDMTNPGERELVAVGQLVYSIFVASLAVGTTRFEVQINGRWIRLQLGNTLRTGDCTPTRRGVQVRTLPALVGLFSQVVIGGTPDTLIQST